MSEAAMWLRAMLLCNDVRFEVGGTMTLVGVLTERIIVEPGDGPVVLAQLAVYSVLAGLSGITELAWRITLNELDRPAERPLIEGREPHDADADEHRLVNILSPLTLPGAGRYLLTMEFEARYERSSIEHCFTVGRAPPG